MLYYIIVFRNCSLSPLLQLLLTLRFYATGSFLLVAGDIIHVSKATSCRVVKRVTRALASLSPRFINMPQTAEEIESAKIKFYMIASLPKCIGAIDCTHIKILSPGMIIFFWCFIGVFQGFALFCGIFNNSITKTATCFQHHNIITLVDQKGVKSVTSH